MSNPFLRMLYSDSFASGYACVPVLERTYLDEIRQALPRPASVTIHYHWVNAVFSKMRTARSVQKACKSFIGTLQRQRDEGLATLWTVHNILSHAGKFIDEELYLRQEMAALVDHIHIMNPDTKALCAPYYSLPDSKIFHSPHPSYTGVYSSYVSREQARLDLGVAETDIVFLAFGAIGPYKGLRHFLDIWPQVQAAIGGRGKLVIAGRAADGSFLKDVQRRMKGHDDIRLFANHIDDQQVQAFFKAADIALCPYQRTLNSGVIMTAATFGKPVILPTELAPILSGAEDGCFTFSSRDMATIVPAVVKAVERLEAADILAPIADWARTMEPGICSQQFFKAYAEARQR
ncbi:hypothetical protein GCM10017044_11380 [Kordiimonas sediminis]|uniref:Glycosyltransferase n=2 Tax=Kordiimonas sediminis TaxID=1735581 RepID=A0A919AQH0_9PROT|nr:hypothetical protein GCM10017044_11380 [Kordiimonas sediminis]